MSSQIVQDGKTYHVYTMAGVKVEIPVKAYPSQVAIMSKIVMGCRNGQHCLLESPTGSGKTLALLCGALSWQKAEKERIETMMTNDSKARQEAFLALEEHLASLEKAAALQSPRKPTTSIPSPQSTPIKTVEDFWLEGDDDFRPMKPSSKLTTKSDHASATPTVSQVPEPMEIEPQPPVIPPVPSYPKVPKIFYGTRTHKQISQVVHEFQRTSFHCTKMVILGSREHTCIHHEVSMSFNKNERCRELAEQLKKHKGPGCMYMVGAQRLKEESLTHAIMPKAGYPTGWDMEDLVAVGKKRRACPYYISRDMLKMAEIVFCPYNYLIDARIRRSMQLDLKGHVVLLDEAHNIEDSAREAASGCFPASLVQAAIKDCEKASQIAVYYKREDLIAQFRQVEGFCLMLVNWMEKRPFKTVEYDKSSCQMTGMEFLAQLIQEGYNEEHLKRLSEVVEKLAAPVGEEELTGSSRVVSVDDYDIPEVNLTLSAATMQLMEGFLQVYHYMADNGRKHIEDYRIAVIKSNRRTKERGRGDESAVFVEQECVLNVWCLNPAVAMEDIRDAVKCLIVTSGTLSPMASFQSELGMKFSISLEANHVIPMNQVLAGVVSAGPRNVKLIGDYKHSQTFEYQDDLGRLLLSICSIVPHGVLCFLPSYFFMEKLMERWESTGLWTELQSKKQIVCEPRMGSELSDCMEEFYLGISDSVKHGDGGSLMFAVYRGKVSEGLDFADNNARAVVCVGIPFPNVKDSVVELKRTYNSSKAKEEQISMSRISDASASITKTVLNGSEWYEIQAYRALNQALGRCIRHKNDWGAILLVDERYATKRTSISSLSKWIRQRVQHFQSHESLEQSLTQFVADMSVFSSASEAANSDATIKEENSEMSATGKSSLSDEKDSLRKRATENENVYGIFKLARK